MKLICFDLDGTLIEGTVYIWKTLYETYVKEHSGRKQLMSDYFSGKISYSDWFYGDLNNFKNAGITKEHILEITKNLKLIDGAIETLNTLKRNKLAVISGSLNIIAETLLPHSTFDYIFTNEIYFNAKGRISGGRPTPYDMKQKADGLTHIAQLENIAIENTIFIGDNQNDVEIAKKAGFSIAFNCKSPELAKICDIEIKKPDLREILKYIK